MARGAGLARLLVAWWLIVLVGAGLIGNGYLAMRMFKAGAVAGGLLFVLLAIGSGVYIWRTFNMWDEIRALWRR